MTALALTVRLLIAGALLIFVYQGSRLALVVVLALLVVAVELQSMLRRIDRDEEGACWRGRASAIDHLEP